MPLPPAILLFAHGSRTPGWEAPFVALRDRLQQAHPDGDHAAGKARSGREAFIANGSMIVSVPSMHCSC